MLRSGQMMIAQVGLISYHFSWLFVISLNKQQHYGWPSYPDLINAISGTNPSLAWPSLAEKNKRPGALQTFINLELVINVCFWHQQNNYLWHATYIYSGRSHIFGNLETRQTPPRHPEGEQSNVSIKIFVTFCSLWKILSFLGTTQTVQLLRSHSTV